MVRGVVWIPIRLDLRDAKPHVAVPDLLAQEVARHIERVTRIELSRE
jgi:hypothetical protein